ncbi:MAG: aldolase, partial [Nitrospirae bacterium]
VFIQGDHFQAKRENFLNDHNAELKALKTLISSAIGAGFFNIDIDASTLVDYSKPTLNGQQEDNFTVTALLTEFIRDIEPEGITVSVGAEIGHIGGKNSTVEEAIAFMEGYLETLQKGPGISKLSVQTGTTHGGIPRPDGTVAEVKLDFSVLKDIGHLVRTRYGLSGTVQHGASTLPEDLFGLFPENNCSEIHLATGFQNIMYEEAPEALRKEIYEYLKTHHRDQWKEGMTEEQFIYKTRKLAFGPFKRHWWTLPDEDKERILRKLEEKFTLLFRALRVQDTEEVVKRYIKPVKFEPVVKGQRFSHEMPEEGAD